MMNPSMSHQSISLRNYVFRLIPVTPWKELFKKQVEHMQKKTRRTSVHVEMAFKTKKMMKDDLGWDTPIP
jgi:hypothetical protein